MTFLALLVLPSFADEGLWRPEQVPAMAAKLKEAGLAVDPANLRALDGLVLGSTVQLAHCSGAFISPEGLVVTGYHCIGDSLQAASLAGEDLFETGFHAKTRGDERWASPEHVRITIATSDVKAEVLNGTRKLIGKPYYDQIELNTTKLVARCEAAGPYHCLVATYDHGAEYQLVTQLEFRDVRLVYAPPRGVGFFGGDDDNWQWPRHSGDFAFLRVYAGPAGEPTPHHPDNVPYKPKTHLKVAKKPVKPGDFSMTAGYPAWTSRWTSAADLHLLVDHRFPAQLEVTQELHDVLGELANNDDKAAAAVAPRQLNVANDMLYLEGSLAALARGAAVEHATTFDRALAAWIREDQDRDLNWGRTLDEITALGQAAATTVERDAAMDALGRDSAMLRCAMLLYTLAVETKQRDDRRRPGFQNRDRPDLIAAMDDANTGYLPTVDRAVLRARLLRALTLAPELRPPELWTWFETRKQKANLEEMVDAELARMYENTDLADKKRRRTLMNTTPWYLTHHGNPWFELAEALHPYYDRVRAEARDREARLRTLRPLYVEAVKAYAAAHPAEQIPTYSDANGTLRLGFGHVRGYTPHDGMLATAQTSAQGILEKHGAYPFDAPEPLIAALREAKWGPYRSDALGSLPIDFLTDLDTTRGSSGSATLNASGEFVGIIFDGNSESMATDWRFDARVARSIHTDVAYILWYLDHMARADALLNELGVEPGVTRTD